ncbi:putative T7SS-secreted protein [Actinoallomurus rhizosphaericola]|uniref:putative T7SS-secreted protein n=1 Tax=Actinoallomurus rhizosphaericola TaxID=2952536 RepID=UPI0020939AE2|nr:hypothetical protein [Actinoallomurus rhizosphaericola]MCO5995462.1 hypothetical protein [Actinoallomurus rhizosphaericola]
MVKQLGDTDDPKELVPGNAEAIVVVAGKMYGYAELLNEAGDGLTRIDTADGWTGPAGDAFRKRFHGHPQKWSEAGECFTGAAKALDDYVPTLVWAQGQAGVAIQQWNQGDHDTAKATLESARGQLHKAAGTAAAAVKKLRDKAPHKPGFWSKVGNFFEGLGKDAEKLGETALNDLASFGNAMLHHPLDDLGLIGGTALAGISAFGDGAGLVLDVTGVGAIAGVPINAISTAGVLAGGTLMMASAGDLASHASGDDKVEPFDTSSGEGTASAPDPQYTEGTPEWQNRIDTLSKDPAKNGASNPASQREATVALKAEGSGDLPGPVSRTPLGPNGEDMGDITDGTGQRWDVKSSPDIRPSYRPNPGQPISSPQSDQQFTDMIDKELNNGQNVLLDPDGMTPARLARLQQIVANNPSWQGRVVWGQ